ncbi:GNAT family N-acetyltransferase [Photobacterium japonica]|uniref:GNAT family N-acetyltransferase n=1 Tax=Photobacterium japonica TaxID=2910235 RepID=UPI003D0A1C59
MMIVREVTIDDAQQMLALDQQLDNETAFMLYEPDERTTTLAQKATRLQQLSDGAEGVMLVAVDDVSGEIVGYIAGLVTGLSRVKHVMRCVIGIKQSYCGQGIGRQLFTALETEARARLIHRLELTVMAHNAQAIGLYHAFGFVKEGVKQEAMNVGGCYVDEWVMGKVLQPTL